MEVGIKGLDREGPRGSGGKDIRIGDIIIAVVLSNELAIAIA